MFHKVLLGALIPLLGTSVGSSVAFASSDKIKSGATAILSGFASGIMVAASVWSLLLPAIEFSALGRLSFIPSCVGLVVGLLMMLCSENIFDKLSSESNREKLLYFAVTLHNIPEGMAIGAAYSAYVCSGDDVLSVSAFLLSFGIAIQNIPEGAIVSLPYNVDKSKTKTFLYGVMSGVVEPFAVIITVLLSKILVPVLPYMLSFAAGAMIFVVLKELVPDFSEEIQFKKGVISFFIGFMIMMSLDVALG